MSNQDLPQGWLSITTSDYVWNKKNDIVDGPFGSNLKSTEYIENGIPVVRIQNVKRFNFINNNLRFVSKEKADFLKRHSFVANDILITKLGDPLGLACIVPSCIEEGIIVADLIRLRVNELMTNQKFMTYLLNSDDVIKQISLHIKGTTRSRINLNIIRDLRLPLPPLAEQKEIVRVVESHLKLVDQIKNRLDALPKILEQFRQSVLASAVSGKLTEDWRKENLANNLIPVELLERTRIERNQRGIKSRKKEVISTPELLNSISTWVCCSLGDIALKITDGAHNTPKVCDQGYPYLMAKSLTSGYLDFSEHLFINEVEHRELYNKCLPEKGDLLIVNIGAGTGNTALIDVDFEFSFKNIAIVKVPSFLLGRYLQYIFDANKLKNFTNLARGGAQPFLSLTILNHLIINLPPLEEQKEIVERVENLFALADQIETKIKNAQERVNLLTQSILAKAFRGELTAKWREENPDLISGENSAEALLKRIEVEKKTNKKK